MRTLFSGFFFAILSVSGAAHGQTAQGDVAVTIYNNNQALIQDMRQVSLPPGISRQEFPDVSASLRPETVTLSASGTAIVEQNFDYDLLTPAKLMDKAVGQTVTQGASSQCRQDFGKWTMRASFASPTTSPPSGTTSNVCTRFSQAPETSAP